MAHSETLQTWQLYQTYIQIIKECIYVRTYHLVHDVHTYSFHDHTDSYIIFQNMKMERKGRALFLQCEISTITVEHGQIITQHFLGEHKVITAEQQFLGLILCFFMYLKWPWLLHLFAVLL